MRSAHISSKSLKDFWRALNGPRQTQAHDLRFTGTNVQNVMGSRLGPQLGRIHRLRIAAYDEVVDAILDISRSALFAEKFRLVVSFSVKSRGTSPSQQSL